MNLIQVRDIKSSDLEIYHKLRDNAFSSDNSFIADSPKVVNVLLETEIEVKSILATQEYYEAYRELIEQKNIPVLYVCTKEMMQSIVGHRVHHNCMMHGIRPQESSLEDLDENILMLDVISSSENIGSIARSAAALGVESYLLPIQSAHPYGRRALRVSMGHVSKLKVHRYEDIFLTIERLKQRGYTIYAAEITATSQPLMDVEIAQKWVLLMGHEGHGIAPEILDVCDEVVHIEMMQGVNSLNVAVAASIMMYQFKNRV